jgi:hypothetical protein
MIKATSTQQLRRMLAPIAGALLLAAVGCGKSEVRVPVVPVTGTIKVGKEIPVGAEIMLHAKGHTLPPGVAPAGRVAEDGTFKVNIYGTAEGVPAGDYVATVQWFKIVKGDGGAISGPNVIPAKYCSPTTSPLLVTVKNEPTVLEPILIR